MNYTTIEAVESYTLKDIDEAFEPKVEEWISAVSRIMDQLTDRKLVADEEESGAEPDYRVFDGNGRVWLPIDDCVEVESVEIGDNFAASLVAVTDANGYPHEAPHRKLYRAAGFPIGLQNVRVAARWGFLDALPDDLKFACTVLVGGIINAQQPGDQAKVSEKIGNYAVTYNDDKGITDYARALAILDGYKRLRL